MAALLKIDTLRAQAVPAFSLLGKLPASPRGTPGARPALTARRGVGPDGPRACRRIARGGDGFRKSPD